MRQLSSDDKITPIESAVKITANKNVNFDLKYTDEGSKKF